MLASLTCVPFESFGRTLSGSHVPFSAGVADMLNTKRGKKWHASCAPRQHAYMSRQVMAGNLWLAIPSVSISSSASMGGLSRSPTARSAK